jgi:transposase
MHIAIKRIPMLQITGQTRFFFCTQAVNISKSFEGLSTLVENLFPNELLSGAYFLFLNRKKDHLKVLYWDVDGFCIWFKRLEKGAFCREKTGTRLNRKDFLLLLEGIEPKRIQPRFSL